MVGAVHNPQLNKKPSKFLYVPCFVSSFLVVIRETWIAGLSFFYLSYKYSAFCGHQVIAALAC